MASDQQSTLSVCYPGSSPSGISPFCFSLSSHSISCVFLPYLCSEHTFLFSIGPAQEKSRIWGKGNKQGRGKERRESIARIPVFLPYLLGIKLFHKSGNVQEVHCASERNSALIQCLPFYVPVWKTVCLTCKFGRQRVQRSCSGKGLQSTNLFGKEVAENCGVDAAESTFMIDFHSSQTDCSVVIFLTHNCTHCSSLLSAGCLNYSSPCPCYLLHKLLTPVSFSMQIHQFYSLL